MPELVAASCIFIQGKFSGGLRKLPCGVKEKHVGEIFRSDAKCEPGLIVLGGWLLGPCGDTKIAPWFSMDVLPSDAPWLFQGETFESSWASAAAELLAALVALKVLPLKHIFTGSPLSHVVHCGEGIDNKAAGSLSVNPLSTKLPVMVVLMEYLSCCEALGVRCCLDWRPRSCNVEADDLTNHRFENFNQDLRVNANWKDLTFPVLSRLIGFAQTFAKRKKEGWDSVSSSEKFVKSSWG